MNWLLITERCKITLKTVNAVLFDYVNVLTFAESLKKIHNKIFLNSHGV